MSTGDLKLVRDLKVGDAVAWAEAYDDAYKPHTKRVILSGIIKEFREDGQPIVEVYQPHSGYFIDCCPDGATLTPIPFVRQTKQSS